MTGKRPAAAAPGPHPDDFSWLLHLFLLAAGSEPDPAEPASPVMAVTTRPVAILMVRGLNCTSKDGRMCDVIVHGSCHCARGPQQHTEGVAGMTSSASPASGASMHTRDASSWSILARASQVAG